MFSLISNSLRFSPKKIGVVLLAIMMAICSSFSVSAQNGGSTIQGTVRDSTGAVIPGARVVVTQKDTNVAKETTTNDSGVYFLPALNAGNFTVDVEATGMKKWQGQALLQVGQNMVINADLEIGDVAAEVTVAGDVTQMISTTDQTISNTLDSRRIEQLATNGRDLLTLIQLTVPGIEGNSGESVGGQRLNGLREAAFEFVQDGASLVNRDSGGLVARPPGLDTIKEVRIETSGSSAKFNRPGTAIISTKSGTNGFHGSVFETHRNSAFGVARRREETFPQAPKYIRNEFGGSIGGPVYLPRFGDGGPSVYNGKNKTFFFLAFEGYELRQNRTIQARVPTAKMRSGDFSELSNDIYDPLSTHASADCDDGDPTTTNPNPFCRTLFPNNQIPLNRLSPFAQKLYEITPLPTNNVNPSGTGNSFNWIGTVPNDTKQRTWTTRIDNTFTKADQASFRYSFGTRDNLYLGGGVGGPPPIGNVGNLTFAANINHSGALTWVHTFSPTFVSETIIAHNYESNGILTGLESDRAWATEFGLPNPFGTVGFFGANNGYSDYGRGDTTRLNYQNISNIDENFTWVKGTHQFEFGGRYRREKLNIFPDQGAATNIGRNSPVGATFNGNWTALLDPTSTNQTGAIGGTGSSAADFFLGNANLYAASLKQGWYRFSDREYAAYFQDNWAVTSRLTLNLGLRWEAHPTLKEKHNFVTGFDEKNKAIVIGQPLEELYRLGVTTPTVIAAFTNLGAKFVTPEQAGLPSGLLDANLFDFAPRAGFAWRLRGDERPWVLRGGYSVFNYPPPLRNFYARTRDNPPFSATFQRSWSDSLQSPDGRSNYNLRSIPDYIAGLNTSDLIDGTLPARGITANFAVSAVGPRYASTKVHEGNLTVEKELPGKIVGRFSMVYNHGVNLEQYRTINDAPNQYVWYTRYGTAYPTSTLARRPYDNVTYGDIEFQEKTGFSNSAAFQVNIQRRFANGYAFQVFYSLTNAFKAGGNGWRDNFLTPETQFSPGVVPTDEAERNRFLNYSRDTGIPKHRVRWNWLADVPVGKGKWLLGNAPGWVNAFVGGWQFSGNGTFYSRYYGVGTGNWVNNADLEVYGKKYQIQRCTRSVVPSTGIASNEVCEDGWLWYNGYIRPSQVNGYNWDNNDPANHSSTTTAARTQTGYFGLPSNYSPAMVPIIQEPTPTSSNGLCPTRTQSEIWRYWNTNTVAMTINNQCERPAYNPGVHPLHKTFILGPFNWGLDVSLFKTFSFNERVKLRVNIDAFNILNNPGEPNSYNSTTGFLTTTSSVVQARQLQGTLRLTF